MLQTGCLGQPCDIEANEIDSTMGQRSLCRFVYTLMMQASDTCQECSRCEEDILPLIRNWEGAASHLAHRGLYTDLDDT